MQLKEVALDDLFDLAPLTQYELYAMGQGPYRQVQCCQLLACRATLGSVHHHYIILTFATLKLCQ